jgi:hypothetical protein
MTKIINGETEINRHQVMMQTMPSFGKKKVGHLCPTRDRLPYNELTSAFIWLLQRYNFFEN